MSANLKSHQFIFARDSSSWRIFFFRVKWKFKKQIFKARENINGVREHLFSFSQLGLFPNMSDTCLCFGRLLSCGGRLWKKEVLTGKTDPRPTLFRLIFLVWDDQNWGRDSIEMYTLRGIIPEYSRGAIWMREQKIGASRAQFTVVSSWPELSYNFVELPSTLFTQKNDEGAVSSTRLCIPSFV